MTSTPGKAADPDALAEGIGRGERAALAQAITLVESRRSDHAAAAARLMQQILPLTGRAQRVGLTGAPGVGKSTLIDALGMALIARGRRVAVLAVDPSSRRTGGSILGDKTRMARLAGDDRAFIRPSPSAGTLGGVAAKTREAMLICEAAGYDAVLVETMGVGQAEVAVADMTDVCVALVQPGAGDELQGLKKGLIETADIVAVNKADGPGRDAARAAAAEYRGAFRILSGHREGTPVLTVSGLTGDGLDALWEEIERKSAGNETRRQAQQVRWMWAMIDERLHGLATGSATVRRLEQEVAAGSLAPSAAAEQVFAALGLR